MTEPRPKHWADELAEQIDATGRSALISSGISPSGEIHIGNMREVLTADAVYRALRDRGASASLNYVADNFDPLRKVYPFLDAAVFEPLIGVPLSELPSPVPGAPSYSEHFLRPFLGAMKELAIEAEVVRADEMYKSGRMTPYVLAALEGRDRIAAILAELTGKEVADDWSPFNVLSPVSGKMVRARILGFSAADESVDYETPDGERGTVPIAGGGKLVWRIDWPARWVALGVTVEPFGKDHSTRGGSYDTGVRIVREIFGGEPPFPIPYEWIRLQGKGDMSSSKGNVLSISAILEVVPPDVLRYMIMRERPQRSIGFNPGLPLLQLVDQVDDLSARGRDERALELSRAGQFTPVGVPFKHLVVVAQIAAFDVDRCLQVLGQTGYPSVDRDALEQRLRYARNWLDAFAPEELRFEVRAELPPECGELDAVQREFLGDLARALEPSMDTEAIQAAIREHSRSREDLPGKHLFEAIYVALLGRPRGPRAAGFISSIGVAFCAKRFGEAGTTATESA